MKKNFINISEYNYRSIHHLLKKKKITGKIYQKFFLHKKLLKQLKGTILDVGAGLGDFIKQCPDGYAVDPDPLNVQEMLNKGINAKQLLNDKIDYNDNFFDSIILDNVLEHITNPDYLLLEIKRVLKPNGIFLIGVPGLKGFLKSEDHRAFYNEYLLKKILNKDYNFFRSFYTPFKSEILNKYLKSYCLYVIFKKKY
jgi:SAM-dependent methyltransferase